FAEWAKHFRAKGWLARTFDYTCDEPPNGCAWSTILARAAMVHAGDPEMHTLVTTSLASATSNGVLAAIDTLVPTINGLDPAAPDANLRASYAPWLGSSPNKRLWIYQSCDSHGCTGVGDQTMVGWPSYMIDAPATLNRAMEWQAWK